MSSVDVERFFSGEALDAKELERRARGRRYPWLTIFKSVEEGTGRQVTISYTSCKRAVGELTKLGKIKKDEFYVTSKMDQSGKRRVYLVHSARPK